jgi:N-carbamoylputrescine amidase
VEHFDLAEPIPGATTQALASLAAELEVVLLAPLFERRAEGLYHNTTVVLESNGRLLGRYRKMHIPDDPGYYEKFYFAPGDLGFRSLTTSVGPLGVLICWDQWFPEAARLTTLQGARLLFYPTAIGWGEGESAEIQKSHHSAWETIQRAHAIANGVFVVAVNRVGSEEAINFWGQSFVCDPLGVMLAKASAETEELLVVDLNLALVEETRRHWPFLRDRRIDSYGGLEARFLDSTET